MNEVRVSAKSVEAVCTRLARERFPEANAVFSALEGEDGMRICVTFCGKANIAQAVSLRRALFDGVQSYTGIRVLSVVTKLEV